MFHSNSRKHKLRKRKLICRVYFTLSSFPIIIVIMYINALFPLTGITFLSIAKTVNFLILIAVIQNDVNAFLKKSLHFCSLYATIHLFNNYNRKQYSRDLCLCISQILQRIMPK